MRHKMCRHFCVIHRQLKVPFEVDGRVCHLAYIDVRSNAGNMVDQLGLKKQIAAGEQIVCDVIL